MGEVVPLFKKEVKDLKDYIVLVTVDAKNYKKTNTDIIKYFVKEKKTPGVYVTLNKPYNIVERDLKNNDIDPRLLIFIDGATNIEGKRNKKIKNCLFLGSLEKLSDFSVAIDQAVKAISHDKFLFFDSINTLSIFNNKVIVARFFHYLTSKMREWKVKGIIVSLEEESERNLLDELTQLADSRIDV